MTDRPTVEESYISAAHTSNLRMVAERTGAADVMVAAGWSDSRIGQALMRLASEWDGAEKRRYMSETDLILLRAKLKSLSNVLTQVTMAMGRMGIDHPEERAGPIVAFWLHQQCHTCSGLKFETIRDTPVLSGIRCKVCHGTGKGYAPDGFVGTRVLAWLDKCVSDGRSSMVRRLRRD